MFQKILIFLSLFLISASPVSAANNTTTITTANSVSTSPVTTAKITIINKATGGDISKNSLLMNYIKKTVLAKQIISKAKYGLFFLGTVLSGKALKIILKFPEESVTIVVSAISVVLP